MKKTILLVILLGVMLLFTGCGDKGHDDHDGHGHDDDHGHDEVEQTPEEEVSSELDDSLASEEDEVEIGELI